MFSHEPYLASSQLSQASPSGSRRRRSKFTYKQLSLLSQSSVNCPLRVIAHIDLDAFYAQCETVRLGISEDKPLAVQQWQGIIAINYPARKFGLGRFSNIAEAKKVCPDLILQHVATWKEGDEKWAYHEDACKHMATHKVSLDPYRLQSRNIFTCVRDVLPPPPLQKVEKASVDEFFLDLSAQIHSILMERYPELRGPPPYDDPTEKLPRPPTTALDWDTDALVDLDDAETEDDDPDWDDVVILIGSEIVRKVRAAIRERLKYTCSAGIARNKMIAKLGSAHKKPNQQTIVRTRAIHQFLSSFKFTKIRNLGGKLGDEIVTTFGTDQVAELRNVSLDQMKVKIGDDTGSWVYHVIRGEDNSEVNPRTQIKSMLSAKSFTKPINTIEQAHRWLRIFIADIYTRLVEEGVVENKRRPKTMNLHHRQGSQTRSRQAPIPTGRPIDETMLFDIAKNILGHVVVDGRAWPCNNLSLAVGGFEEGPTGNRGIGGFLVRGEEAKRLASPFEGSRPPSPADDQHPSKRRKLEGGALPALFARRNTSLGESSDATDGGEGLHDQSEAADFEDSTVDVSGIEETRSHEDTASEGKETQPGARAAKQSSITSYFCDRCKGSVPVSEKAEHDDWHFARDLQKQEQAVPTPAAPSLPSTNAKKRGPGRPNAAPSGEKGQQRLVFGK